MVQLKEEIIPTLFPFLAYFNSFMVQLKVLNEGFDKRPRKNFNSFMVQLKAIREGSITTKVSNFNSFMVQLKAFFLY